MGRHKKRRVAEKPLSELQTQRLVQLVGLDQGWTYRKLGERWGISTPAAYQVVRSFEKRGLYVCEEDRVRVTRKGRELLASVLVLTNS